MITGRKLWNKEARAGILFASPVIAGFLIFVLGPMIASFIFSLSEYNVITPLKFTGFSNYSDLFDGKDPLFYKSLGVTGYYVILSVPLQILLAFMVALLLNQPIKGKAFFRTVFYMPTIVPAVASSMIWLWLFDPDLGLLNQLLKVFGLPGLQWIYSENLAVPSLVLMSLWTIGGTMVIFLAGLQGIPKHLYESVEVDGGGPFHKLFSITIPLMTPTIFFNLVMGFIGSFQVFGQAYIMTQGGPNNATLFYSYYLYREAFEFSSMGSASAIAWILFLVILALTLTVFKTSALWVYSESEGKR
ncbi:sugar ABC transporter permease [Paenibacillus sp. ATY16]|uniref:carbohydrate ABC transporter permease n=1 Tax=Paenibacillus sp. ATY16 TaxID=1759312 RepID=UPI00200F9111|nr:sugar ABC transporter permease [Paenibacillus sp. ATY16]MCK9859519.1 sugar ABC transporter permease [Paenibacillus sp. ATY16]